jgi:LmbE family N-acetylglucosaminyl deacetylase
VTQPPDTPGTRPGASGLPVGDLLTAEPLSVDLPVPESALAIGAHPDDIEFGCGATLAKWAAAGCAVHHLVLTDGSKGSWDPAADLDLLVAERRQECRAAAGVIDGNGDHPSGSLPRVRFLGSVDGELENGVTERRAVAQVIRTVRPAVLLGHDPWRRYRLHPDHRAAGFLTLDALVAARDPHFFPELQLAPHRPGALALFEADLPNHLERADGFDGTKIEALLCHRSQWESTMGIDPGAGRIGDARSPSGPTLQEQEFAAKVRRQLADHGALAGYAAAEAFHLMTDL